MLDFILLIVIALACNALISATEAALLAVPASRVAVARAEGKPGGAILEALKAEIQKPLAALVTLSNIVTIVAAWIVGAVALEHYGPGRASLLLVLFTVLAVVFAELVPKIVGVRIAESLALHAARPLRLLVRLLNPFIRFTYFLAGLVTTEKPAEISEEEIEELAMLGARSGSIELDEAAMIQRIFKLNDVTTRDLMTPRSQVFFLEADLTLDQARERIIAAHHSRIPVVADHSFIHVLGVVHQRDLLIALQSGRGQERVRAFAKKPLLVPEQLLADELLREFQIARTHLAIAINEHGEPSGVVTLEDCLEELVGEIIDEKDVVPEVVKRISKDEILAHGETRGRNINSLFQTDLPENKTLTEYLLDHFHRIPEKGEILELDNLRFRIEEVSGGLIGRIRITRMAPAGAVHASRSFAPPA